jgi:hypothetical protein
MYRENSFDAHAVGNLANGKSFAYSRTLASDDETLEDLNTALVTFNDADVNFKFIAGTEIRKVLTKGSGIYRIKHVHGLS